MSTESGVLASPASPRYLAWRRDQRREGFTVRAIQVLLVVVLLAAWEAGARMHWMNPMLTSYPSAIWLGLRAMLLEGTLGSHLSVTLIEVSISFGLALALGTSLAVLLWLSPRAERVMDPFLVVANALPKVALVPIVYIWLGPELSIYGIAVAIAVFIVALMIFTGFRQTDPNKIKLVRTLGASRAQMLSKVVLPGSVPTLIAAMKANAALSLVGVIVGEFQSGKAGLGYLITYDSQIFQMDRVMVSVVLLGVISLAMYVAIQGLEALLMGRRK